MKATLPIRRIITMCGAALALMCAVSTVAFMFYTEPAIRWTGQPVLRYQVNPDFPGLAVGSGPDRLTVLSTIQEAAAGWFAQGGSPVALSFAGATERTGPAGPPWVECPGVGQQVKPLVVVATEEDDPDCTGDTCVFVWTCGLDSEIVHADIQINAHSTALAVGGNTPLLPRMLHAFGHALGLDHCSPGETTLECARRQGPGQGGVPAEAAMSAFPGAQQLAADDRDGLRTLYGELDLPFPTTGPYRLSAADVESIIEARKLEADLGFTTAAQRAAAQKYISDLVQDAEIRAGKNLTQQMNEFYDYAIASLGPMNAENLGHSRETVTIGMYGTLRWMEDTRAGRSSLSMDFLNALWARQDQLRRATIDAQGAQP